MAERIDTRVSATLDPVMAGKFPKEGRFVNALNNTFPKLQEMHDYKEKLHNDPKLTEAGAREAARIYVDSQRGAIEDEFSTMVDFYQKRIDNATARLNTPIDSDDKYGAEIRSHFKENDKRVGELFDAIGNGDRETTDAIISAPFYLSGFSKEDFTRLQRKFYETTQPDLLEDISYNEKLHSTVARMAGLLPAEFQKAGGS